MPQTLPKTVLPTPMKIWNAYMTEIHKGLVPIDFIDPMVVEELEPEPLEDNEGEQEEETVVEETTEVVTEDDGGAPAGNNEIEP